MAVRDTVGAVLHADRMYAEKSQEDELKEIKVKVPLEYHIKLHGLKLLNNRSISQTVQAALDRYFERLEAEKHG